MKKFLPGTIERLLSTTLLSLILSLLMQTYVFAAPSILTSERELDAIRARIQQEPLKSYYSSLQANTPAEAAPVLYLLNGEQRHAETSRELIRENLTFLKKYIPYMVDIWILRSPGRVVSTVLAYNMTKDSGVYSTEDIREIEETLAWCMKHYLNEGRDHLGAGFTHQTDYLPADMDDWVIANMNVHRLLAMGLYGLAFPGNPRSKEIVEYCEDYYERILSLGSRPGGAWAENPRYAGGVLRELFMLAKALKNAGRQDFFADERLRALLGFFAESIPVPGIDDPNRPTMLAADDSHWWENRATILSWAAPVYKENEPQAAREWIWCWQKLDAPLAPESLIFVDTSISAAEPAYTSYSPGMGYALFRHKFGAVDESFLFATFGAEPGTSNKTMHHQPNHGDFSFIWRGHPLILTRGCSSYMWSRRMRDQIDFANSVVTFDGAGDGIVIPEAKYGIPALESDRNIDESLSRDHYSDGLTHFVTGGKLDYAAGTVRNWEVGLPADFNVRHILYLKPDIVLIRDQVRSSYPLQWNLHMPAERVVQDGNAIVLTNRDGVDLRVDFLQEEPLDLTVDWPLESIRADWPLVLACPYGEGSFVFNTLDIARQILDSNHPGARKIYENILCYPSKPKRIGLIATDGQTASVLEKLGYDFDYLDYRDLDGDLSGYDSIVVGHFATLVRDRDLFNFREKLWDYVKGGGVCLWQYQYAWGWRPGDLSGTGYFPHTLMIGEGTSVVWGEGVELERPVTMHESPLWQNPNRIGEHDWLDWQVGVPDTFKVMPVYPILPNTDRARNIPVYYSDHWKVLASAKKTWNIQTPATRPRFGPYRWIKVHHKPSQDYLAVLRPRQKGSGGQDYPEIVRGQENGALLRQGNENWLVLYGKHEGFSGTVAAMNFADGEIGSGSGSLPSHADIHAFPKELLLVDSIEAAIGGLTFSSDSPATLHWDSGTGLGSVTISENSRIILPWKRKSVIINGKKTASPANIRGTRVDLSAGEYSVAVDAESVVLTLKEHIAILELADRAGKPAQWVQASEKLDRERTWFRGATDKHGRLTLRWKSDEGQAFILKDQERSTVKNIRPGLNRIEWAR